MKQAWQEPTASHQRKEKVEFRSYIRNKLMNRKPLNTLEQTSIPTYCSPRLGSWLGRGVNVGALIRAHPFYWDWKTNELKLRNGAWDLALWRFNIAFEILYFAFVTYQTFFSGDLNGRGNLFMKFCTIFTLLSLMCQVWLLQYARENLPGVATQGLGFMKEFHGHVRPVVGPGGKILEIRLAEHFLAFLYIGFQFCAWSFTLLSLLQPNLRIFPSSVRLPRFKTLQHLLSFVAIGHYGQNVVASLCIMLFPGTWMMFTTMAAINGMRHSSAMRSKQSSRRLLRSYREVQIFSLRFFGVYDSFLVPAGEVMMILTVVYAIVCVLRLRDVVGALIGTIGFIGYVTLLVIFRGLGEIQVRSEKMLRQWRRQCTLDRRTWRYLQGYKCPLGNFGFVDPGLILTATDIIVSNAVSLLLVINSK